MPITACDLLYERVPTFYEALGVKKLPAVVPEAQEEEVPEAA